MTLLEKVKTIFLIKEHLLGANEEFTKITPKFYKCGKPIYHKVKEDKHPDILVKDWSEEENDAPI